MSIANLQASNDQRNEHRSKGERTREKILVSAIEVLAKQGIKGTTHRAIANHAEIQLSLTTYYFKDIQQLVQQAFELNSEYLRNRTDGILQQAFASFENLDTSKLGDINVKIALCDQLSSMTAKFLFENINKETTSLAVEQLMYTAVQVTPELKKLANEHDKSQLIPFTLLAGYFNKNDPEVDARIMRTIFSQLQYSQLSLKKNERSIEPIQKVTRKLIAWIMGVPN